METFNCDNNEIKLTLRKLHKKIVDNGGWLNPEVVIHESKGELSVRSNLDATDNEILIRIPEECLPTINNFEFYIENDELRIQTSHSRANDLYICLIELMLDIYNQTQKLSWHRKTSPWFAFSKFPRLLDKLYEGRASASKVHKYHDLYKSGDYDQLLIDSFLGSRTLNFKSSDSKKAEPRLMPFIDYVNHNQQCPGFKRGRKKDNNGNELSIVNAKPMQDSDECFVSYSKTNDSLDTYLVYGFIDISISYVRSIPVKIIFPNGEILNVHSKISRGYKGQLPSALENLRLYIPNPIKNGQKYEVSCLIIPGEKSPLALRRVLKYLIRSILPGVNQDILHDYILLAEETVLINNISYYKELRLILDSAEEGMLIPHAVDTVNDLITEQLHKLNGYKERMSLIF